MKNGGFHQRNSFSNGFFYHFNGPTTGLFFRGMFTLPSSKWKKHSQTGPPVKPELMSEQGLLYLEGQAKRHALRLHGMSWGVKTTCFKAPEVSLGGSGVSIGGVRSLRVWATVRKHSALLSMILYHAFCGKMTGSSWLYSKKSSYTVLVWYFISYIPSNQPRALFVIALIVFDSSINEKCKQTQPSLLIGPASSSQMGNIAWKKMQHAK